MSAGQISSLMAIWSAVSFLAEIPTGALADRVDRRTLIVIAEIARAAGFAAWALWPSYAGFAVGFAIWGVAGSLISGAMEAMVYDSLAADGQSRHFATVLGRIRGAGLIAQVPIAGAASLLYAIGGYSLATWASVGMSLVAAVLALRLPDRRPIPATDRGEQRDSFAAARGRIAVDPVGVELVEPTGAARRWWRRRQRVRSEPAPDSIRGLLRDGWRQVSRAPSVRRAVIAVAALGGLDAVEEYFGLIIRGSGVSTGIVPFAAAAIYLFAAVCGAAAGLGRAWSGYWLAVLLGAGSIAFAFAIHAPPGAAIVLVALYYGAAKLVLVIYEARLQDELNESSRATATSMAALATEIVCFAVYAGWAIREVDGLVVVSLLAVVVLVAVTAADRRAARRGVRSRN